MGTLKGRTFILGSIILAIIILNIYIPSAKDKSKLLTDKLKQHLLGSEIHNTNLQPKDDREGYWSDEFDGREINDHFWTIQQGGGIWGNNEMQYYTANPKNCRLENGKLIIAGQKEDYNGMHYTSARISTKEKVDFHFGSIEIKAKLPKGKGLLPAIWLMPTENIYSPRRKNGEIDIVEMLSEDPKVIYGVAHFLTEKKSKESIKYYYGEDLSKDFHVYALEWNSRQLKWLIDNQVYYTLDLEKTFEGDFNPFTKRFYLIINLAIGGNWPGYIIDDQAFPAEMEIDYVRYREK